MKRVLKRILPICLAALVFCSIAWYLFVYDRDFTRDMLLSAARHFESEGDHSAAAWIYDLAYRHANNDENVAIELAEQYKSAGNYTKAEVTLSKAIRDGGTAKLYIRLMCVSVPLSGVMIYWPAVVLTAIERRAEPTPGSTTLTNTVPAGQ